MAIHEVPFSVEFVQQNPKLSRWKDYKSLVQTVRLFMIDEVHLLNDDTRGATMEAVVSRMKTVQISINKDAETGTTPNMRFMAVSATIPNVNDVSQLHGPLHLYFDFRYYCL